jgi:hypothetical protein
MYIAVVFGLLEAPGLVMLALSTGLHPRDHSSQETKSEIREISQSRALCGLDEGQFCETEIVVG